VVTAVRNVRYQVTEKTKKAKALSTPFVVSKEIVEELLFCEQCPTPFRRKVVGSATIYLNNKKEYHDGYDGYSKA
jgi:hypothetical protein